MAREHAYLSGLVGTGVTPSLTPPLHMAEGRAQGLQYVYRPIDLTALELDLQDLRLVLNWAEMLGFDALNITHPCKRDVIQFLDDVDPVAKALGAVNTVLLTAEGRIGYNTDTTGFERAFRTGLSGAATDRVVMLGAGGAGSAVGDALLRLGVAHLTIIDLDRERADEVATNLTGRHSAAVQSGGFDDLEKALANSDGIVQCTPIGMHNHPGTPFDVALLRPEHWVADIVYRPLETELLRAARAKGCRTMHGGLMAVAQAADTFQLVTGRDPDLERMQAHFQSLVDDDEVNPERYQ
ncbi:shikimate dehydrogenase [Leucobacter viscericola]|uniref:Quinate/shikimate dehydrogenase (NAD(+)) n=1 Tax=Leucobacter viscericola TaxID=2714935 RepID=A0A6G7XGZ5_9MICO|nr:shikimate dehydrogenase [Leucobacter viscericola]QIK63648.1 shikimate dehydrogenase [Leucobacter viscericola]